MCGSLHRSVQRQERVHPQQGDQCLHPPAGLSSAGEELPPAGQWTGTHPGDVHHPLPHIPGTSGVGQCATRLRPRPQSDGKRIRECQRRACDDDKLASCWRDQQGACILQTRCEAQRRNCVRNPLNQWVRTSKWSCQGNVVGGGIRRCRTRPIIIKD
ncbi:GD16735 [Drosophila simulans]|uniref:GD16735 n=1 Tax=Drosophila simulans TaxID=7240 RepID=B4R4Z2_DROSI|nr:GD16735 [Drosophila simulans]